MPPGDRREDPSRREVASRPDDEHTGETDEWKPPKGRPLDEALADFDDDVAPTEEWVPPEERPLEEALRGFDPDGSDAA